jgi:hypothetical protein
MYLEELVDYRPNDAPLALWRNMIVLSVHDDGKAEMTVDWKELTDSLVYDIVLDSTGYPPPRTLPDTEF